jgi:hypothetical protein
MVSTFELPITHLGKEFLFPAEIITKGYSYQIKVVIEEVAIFFEPDEEKKFRALASGIEMKEMDIYNKDLLEVICDALFFLFG